ncbi:hypothetical protein OSB04_013148 [Centaurea solstitialis]|uniref:F-box domain-containing protein n=1 Tax=Centaurea solstitialis TaxID=347529 RepID=A0AA38TEG1_9ASTR|nr:hypothetical protein OSB04_013148 [Centaurea solstitialis]
MAVDLLPDELIVEILSMLPAKSLLRCRLVSKSWLNFINSTKFKVMHLHNFNQLNPRYFIRRLIYYESEEYYDVYFDNEAFTLDGGTQIQFPLDSVSVCFRIVGCCNGVVCLSDDNNDDDDDEDEEGFSLDTIILWNPSIRRKLRGRLLDFGQQFGQISVRPKVLVNALTADRVRYADRVSSGLWYDKLSDDYKVVYLAYHHFSRPRVQVYTVKTGIWRQVMFPENLLCYFINPNRNRLQVFFNGSLHWMACHPNLRVPHTSIMTFDTSTELFGEILLPDDLLEVPTSTMMISVVGESLAVTHYNNPINGAGVISSTYKTWVMKEYKNPTSWTLIYSMHHPDVDMGIPLQMRNKGDMIMKSRDENIILYNYSGYASCICQGYEPGLRCTTYVDKYQESLALLDVGDSVSNEEGD